MLHDLNAFPYPWDTNSIDHISAHHIIEHLDDWWAVFNECVRILKPGGALDIRVPDESSSTALTYRDHHHVFSLVSFHGVQGYTHGSSAWADKVKDQVPVTLTAYHRVPHEQYQWLFRFPFTWLGEFCANHLRNFIWEQRFWFVKKG